MVLTVAHKRPKSSCSLMIITIERTSPSSTIFACGVEGEFLRGRVVKKHFPGGARAEVTTDMEHMSTRRW